MTRTCFNSSRKKPLSQDVEKKTLVKVIEKKCDKENIPLTPQHTKRNTDTKKRSISTKGKVSINSIASTREVSVNSSNNASLPIRKSARKTKSVKISTDKNILCDKTNTPTSFPNNLLCNLDQNIGIPIKTGGNKNKIIHKLTTLPKPNIDIPNKNHIPIYKTVVSVEAEMDTITLPNTKNEAVYDFEVDENEEPAIHRKKRKKKLGNKKPKLGPNSLTINNIKYSSTESLVSLPEKPYPRKKNTRYIAKNNQNTFTSINNLPGAGDPPCSPNIMKSHLESLGENKYTKSKCELSILLESQSELNTSQIPSGDNKESIPLPVTTTADIRVSRVPDPNLEGYEGGNFEEIYDSWCPNKLSASVISQASPCVSNISTASSQHFHSSTPCKQTSAIVSNNSYFDDSCDLQNNGRQHRVHNTTLDSNALDNCFGFDDSDNLKQPVVSPVKNNIHVENKRAVKKTPYQPLNDHKPSAQEVIELLKASIPKHISKQRVPDMYDIMSENGDSFLPLNTNDEVVELSFKKPPRRSYERPRRIKHKSESEQESETEDDKDLTIEPVKETVPKGRNKCYRKANTTRSAQQPKLTKAKRKLAKEEEEMERLAAIMNAQFQEIEKVSLVVE